MLVCSPSPPSLKMRFPLLISSPHTLASPADALPQQTLSSNHPLLNLPVKPTQASHRARVAPLLGVWLSGAVLPLSVLRSHGLRTTDSSPASQPSSSSDSYLTQLHSAALQLHTTLSLPASSPWVELAIMGGAAVIYSKLLVSLLLRHERQVGPPFLLCLMALLAEGWLDLLHITPVIRGLVLEPICLNIVASWAVCTDRESYPVPVPASNEKTAR